MLQVRWFIVGKLLFPVMHTLRACDESHDYKHIRSLNQDYLVFGSDLGFRSQMLRFSRNIASTARSYSGKTFTHIK